MSGVMGMQRMMAAIRHVVIAALALALVGACHTGRDYPDVTGPRHAGAATRAAPAVSTGTLRIVSFNIEFAKRIDAAIRLLTSDSALRGADVILLQEMDADATKRIADTLNMAYVYYPALHHRRTGRDFGNAVLSRWPIVADAKLILPNPSWYAGTHRIATAATIEVRGARIRVYSTHLATIADVLPRHRRAQLRTILDDAIEYRFAIIGGDMNDADIGRDAVDAGFVWPTQEGPRTTRFGRWDHVFIKGLRTPDSSVARSGTVAPREKISDHVPVWAVGILP